MRGRKPLEGALRIVVTVMRNRSPTARPDADNYLKAIDAFNGIVWRDDAQVIDARVVKVRSVSPALQVRNRSHLITFNNFLRRANSSTGCYKIANPAKVPMNLPSYQRIISAQFSPIALAFQTFSGPAYEQQRTTHIEIMADKDIFALPVQSLAADDCVLFFWVTAKVANWFADDRSMVIQI